MKTYNANSNFFQPGEVFYTKRDLKRGTHLPLTSLHPY